MDGIYHGGGGGGGEVLMVTLPGCRPMCRKVKDMGPFSTSISSEMGEMVSLKMGVIFVASLYTCEKE